MRINDGNHPVARAQHAFKPATAHGQLPAHSIAPHYNELDFLVTGETPGTCRWPDEAFPLKIWLEPHSEMPDFEHETFAMIAHWEFASDHKITFATADSPEVADVIVSWIEETSPGRDFEMGHADRTVDPQENGAGLIRFVKVNLQKKPLINAYFSSKNALKSTFFATILHEFGHVLGLEHSENPADVMHHRGFQNAKLSENDVRRLKFLYR